MRYIPPQIYKEIEKYYQEKGVKQPPIKVFTKKPFLLPSESAAGYYPLFHKIYVPKKLLTEKAKKKIGQVVLLHEVAHSTMPAPYLMGISIPHKLSIPLFGLAGLRKNKKLALLAGLLEIPLLAEELRASLVARKILKKIKKYDPVAWHRLNTNNLLAQGITPLLGYPIGRLISVLMETTPKIIKKLKK